MGFQRFNESLGLRQRTSATTICLRAANNGGAVVVEVLGHLLFLKAPDLCFAPFPAVFPWPLSLAPFCFQVALRTMACLTPRGLRLPVASSM